MDTRAIRRRMAVLVGDYLTYNRAEQRGIVVLSMILMLVIVAGSVIPEGTLQESPDFSAFSKEIREFESAWQKAADSDSIARAQKFQNYKGRFGKWSHDSAKYKAMTPKPVVIIELNSADTFDLQQLRGIGPGFARRIVNYRERLGGYCDKRQVLEVFGMDTARYRLIEKNLAVNKDSVHTINLNIATFKELLHHPYFPFAVTKNIMIYRQKNKVFRSVDEIRNIGGVTDSLFSRMVVYLRLGP
ncbi:MAG: helix-hairpin-helix domain-containing protein [bacterium]